jgi:hypothetical protein
MFRIIGSEIARFWNLQSEVLFNLSHEFSSQNSPLSSTLFHSPPFFIANILLYIFFPPLLFFTLITTLHQSLFLILTKKYQQQQPFSKTPKRFFPIAPNPFQQQLLFEQPTYVTARDIFFF